MNKKINILGVCWDYLWMNKDSSKGDFLFREEKYASYVESMHRIVYSPFNYQVSFEEKENTHIYYTRSIHKFLFLFDVLRIAFRILKKRRIDMFSAEDPCLAGLAGLIIKVVYRIPLHVQMHYDAIDNSCWISQRKRHIVYNLIAKFVIKKADNIRVVSVSMKNKLISLGVSEKKISVLPVMIDISKFKITEDYDLWRKYRTYDSDKLILFVGRLSPEKDISTLIIATEKAIRANPHIKLLIVGDGVERENLHAFVSRLNMNRNIFFAGPIPYKDIPKYFNACDVFVLPSLREARGNVIVEAALSRKPVITTKGTGAEEWVAHSYTGFVFKQRDSDALSRYILYLTENPDIAKIMGESAYSFVKDKLGVLNNPASLIKCWESAVNRNT